MNICMRRSCAVNALLHVFALVLTTSVAWGDTEYYRHSVFDNSLTTDSYYHSRGHANGSSLLELQDGKLPVETKTFFTPPNALRLQWQSQADGGWEAEIHVDFYRYRFPEFKGQNLYFWCFAPQAIAADDLPDLVVSNTSSGLQVAEFPRFLHAALANWEVHRCHPGRTIDSGANSTFGVSHRFDLRISPGISAQRSLPSGTG
jgi:hypothetical protein